LNDRFGIQTRGGCSCAGTYGHVLLEVDENYSRIITNQINIGDLTNKPGWIRMSIHPIMTNAEMRYITSALKDLAANFNEWAKDYKYVSSTNDFKHNYFEEENENLVNQWFDLKN
jgi:hypothetical protein